jgi:O-acetyl-ADP-ribose deacetylase (regulator of RNase III)
MKLILCDQNPEVTAAWRKYFGTDPDVQVSDGDIFQHRADAIVSPANSFGFLDGGIDLAYSRHFGWEMSERLRETIRDAWSGEIPVGQAAVVATGSADIPWLVSAPTMRVPSNVADTVNAWLAFRAALIAVRQHESAADIETLLCPGLGTAVGRMPAERCARQMYAAWFSIQRGFVPNYLSLGLASEGHYALLR